MSSRKKLVLDANILVRAVFGERVCNLLKGYEDVAEFYAPDLCIEEARKHLPAIAARRRVASALAEATLSHIVDDMISVVDCSLYEDFEERARARISSRDAGDWPVVATALLIDAPIWTEDRDFIGSGIATWTSSNVELYLRDA
ncbi:MAG: PIN domain-containing protein [Terracidiphilus sp.]|jgi:predicted nucleic acid-binding protein